ncbi:MAG: tetratricopeptide repeat protein [Candidatus Kuenenia sp.]|nr:tetratricopeptide repeat protein [Candidatus Kuenenia hertensis]
MKNISKNIIICCDKIIIGLLCAATVVVPLFFDIRLYSVFDLSKVTALYLFSIVILVMWTILLAVKHDFTFLHVPINIPVLAYIAVFVVATSISINPIMSLFGTYKRFEGLTATICYIFLFYATIHFITTRTRFYLLFMSMAGCAVISSIYGIFQRCGIDYFSWSSSGPRVFSTFGNPVFFAAQLVMVLPVAVSLFFGNCFTAQKGNGENGFLINKLYVIWIFYVVSVIIYTAFWLTNTRACFVALIGGVFPFLFFIFKNQTTGRHKFVIIVVSFILIGIFFNVRHDTSFIKHFADDVQKAKDSGEESPVIFERHTHPRPWISQKFAVTGSSFSRIFQYLAAIEIIKDYPALGIGPDTIGIVFQKNLAKVFSVLEKDKGFQFPRQDRIHNDILDTAVTRGIFGLGTYVWLLVAFGIYVSKNYKHLNNQDKILILGLSSGLICYLIQNQFSFGNTPIVMLFWVMMGLCISIIKINNTEKKVAAEEERLKHGEIIQKSNEGLRQGKVYLKWICCGLVFAMLGFITVFILRAYTADMYFEYGRRILNFSEREKSEPIVDKGLFFINKAVLLNPYENMYRDELCKVYIQKASNTNDEKWVQKAFVEANNSLMVIPQHFVGFFHFGMIYQMLAEKFNRPTVDQAIDFYNKAIEMDPFQAQFHGNLGFLYLNKGNKDRAAEEFYQAYLIRPTDLTYLERLTNIYLQKGEMEKAFYFSKKTVEINPSEPAYYNNFGAIFLKKGMPDKAIESFKKALELNPDGQAYLENLTKTCLSVGKYDELLDCYKNLIERNPSVADYYNNIAVIYKRKQQYDDAIQFSQKAVELAPDNPIYTHNLAGEYLDVQNYDRAEVLLREFNRSYTDHGYINIHLLLADIYLKKLNWENAVNECQKAIKINEKSIDAHRILGIAYYNMKQYELAKNALSKTLILAPDDKIAHELLEKIGGKI